MCDGEPENLSRFALVGKWGVSVFDPNVDIFTNEREMTVAQHGTGQEPGFQKNLKSVADTQDHPSPPGEFNDGVHDGRKSGYSTGSQVVPIGKSPWQDDGIHAFDGSALMPDKMSGLSHDLRKDMNTIAVAIGSGKDNDADVQCTLLLSKPRTWWKGLCKEKRPFSGN
jgi:hypothetical protein